MFCINQRQGLQGNKGGQAHAGKQRNAWKNHISKERKLRHRPEWAVVPVIALNHHGYSIYNIGSSTAVVLARDADMVRWIIVEHGQQNPRSEITWENLGTSPSMSTDVHMYRRSFKFHTAGRCGTIGGVPCADCQ